MTPSPISPATETFLLNLDNLFLLILIQTSLTKLYFQLPTTNAEPVQRGFRPSTRVKTLESHMRELFTLTSCLIAFNPDMLYFAKSLHDSPQHDLVHVGVQVSDVEAGHLFDPRVSSPCGGVCCSISVTLAQFHHDWYA